MSVWRQTTLGNVIALQRGHDLPERSRRPGTVPVVGSAGPNGWHDEPRAPGPGVTVGRSGASIGVVTYVPTAFWPHNTALYVRDFKGNDPAFIAHLLRTMPLAEQNSGSAQPSLNRNYLYHLPTYIPDPNEQRRIALILGAYDDLIEVNRRRIALLERMARSLFEEWFVRLRFPGHDSEPPPSDELPNGWRHAPLSELAQFINGFAFKPSHFQSEGFPIIKIPELKVGVTGKTPRNSGATVPPPLHVQTGDLLFSWSGTLAVNEWTGGPALLNQHLFRVVPKERVGRAFLKEALIDAMPRFESQAVGATMRHIRRAALDTTTVALPDDDRLLDQADRSLSAWYDARVNLRQQNERLGASRDLLLPRLISGPRSIAAAEREVEQAAE